MVHKIILQFLIFTLLVSCRSNAQGDQNSDNNKNTEESVQTELKPISPSSSGKTVLNPEVIMDRTRFLTGEEQEIFLLVKFDIPEQEEIAETRPDLSLSMVLDRSGSMSDEGKMNYTSEAASLGVSLLKKNDQLAIVEYDNRVTPLWPLSRVNSSEIIQQMLTTLTPRGGTNLCGGMDEGIAQLQRDSSGALKRVILLSDGLANQGITDPKVIAAHARRAYQEGITVSTMGVGLDYNEDLMMATAEAGGGNYFFIENPKQIHNLFSEEMAGLFQTVAQNISLSLTGRDVIKSFSIVGEKGATKTLSSLYGGEKQSVLFKLTIQSKKRGKNDLGELKISYTIPKTEKREELTYPLAISGTKDSSAVNKSVAKPVLAEATLIEAEKVHEESIRLYEAGKKQEALAQIERKNSELKSLNSVLNDKRLGSKIEAFDMEKDEMKEAEQSIQNRKRYLKRSKSRSYNSKKGKMGFMHVGTGSGKNEVLRIQKQLKKEGYYTGDLDGVYSPEMIDAVKRFQKDKGLQVDGTVGPKTQKKLGLY